jgi:3-hydroxyisobutyrate dehydrogenase
MNIGFIGLGMMGYPMARLLAKGGHALTVKDINPAAVERFIAEHSGCTSATGAESFAGMDIIITMLPDSSVVEAEVLGSDAKTGVASVMRQGAVLVDMSSSEPLRSRQLGHRLQELGINYLDAPVSGGVKRATDGSLAIMVGGEPEVLQRCEEVLRLMGKQVTHVGAAGSGHAMKALNNYVSAAGLVAAVEALQVGQAFGLDPAVMVDVMNNSTARNNTTENKVKQFMLSEAFNSGFSLSLMTKDLGIAMGLGQSISRSMPLGEEVLRLWRSANEALGKGADHTEMFRYYAQKGQE